MDIRNLSNFGALAAACLLLAACSGGGGSDAEGKLSLSITDAPIYEANLVEIDVIGVEVKHESGPAFKFSVCEDPDIPTDPPVIEEGECTESAASELTIDLLQYTSGASLQILDDVSIPAGRVNWVRLMLKDPAGRIELPVGGEKTLTVPSNNQTGLKLNRGFDIVAGEVTRVTIDFDVRKSIVEASGEYKLKPTLRLVEAYGAIAGTVDAALRPPACLGPSIYVFAGAASTPDDIDPDNGDPVSTTMVDDLGKYRADFLEPGEYRAAFVCAEGVTAVHPADDPDSDDMLSFEPPTGSAASVVDGQTVTLDFN